MIHVTAYETLFSASHQASEPPCDKPHGHTWHVRVAVQGEPDPDLGGGVVSPKKLGEAVERVTFEVDHRDLNRMIAPALPTPNGVAAWIWEKLALDFRLDEVKVWHEHGEGLLRRER